MANIVTGNHSHLPKLPLRLSALQIMGVRAPDEGNWAQLRALQYSKLYRVNIIRGVGHSIAGIFTLSLFQGKVSTVILGIWLFGLVAAVANTTRIEMSLKDIDYRMMSTAVVVRHALSVIGCGAAWGVALFFFPQSGTLADHLTLWILVTMLFSGSAATMNAAPLSPILFVSVAGGAAFVTFLMQDQWQFAVVTGVFMLILIKSTIDGARSYLTARIAEAGAAEKDEVVSLLLREFEENEADWLWQIDTNRRVRAVSPRFAFALGLDIAEIEGKGLIRLLAGENMASGDIPASLCDLAERLKRRENFSNLLVRVDVAAGSRWWELSGTPIIDSNGSFTGFRGVGSDVTEQRESDEKIAYLARYDTLTGLPNRLMLTEALGDAMRYSEQWKTRCGFLMIDLDRFKAVNDSLGHMVGDKLLAQVSLRLQSFMTDNEHCGRLGGDEFAVVIRDVADATHIADLANAIIESLSKPYQVDGNTLFTGASIGSAVGPRDGANVETLMRNADLALYRAKDEGGGTHCNYVPSLHVNAEERRRLEVSLRSAIGKDELLLNFQPVVNSITEEVVSFEALLRWNSAEHGFVSPGKFIPVAEDTRLIVPIGQWVLHQSCLEAAKWPDHIGIAVNVSGEQLLEPGFSSSVVKALADTGLAARRLEVEVTESIFLRDGETARQTLEEIMALGCSVALDDFGTGYSSLGYLRKLRFSTIKVDRSFVQGAGQGSQESLAIIRAVVAMAQSLEMSTTAEGVEDADEAALIRKLGCDKIQGYYFGRPMPSMEARALIASPKSRGKLNAA